MRPLLTIITLLMLYALPASAQTEVTLTPAQDNTLYEDDNGDTGNGAGQYLFIGSTNQGELRRALVRFDVASVVPAGATIESVVLTMNVSKLPGGSGTQTATLYRATAAWGEGTSDAGGEEGGGTAATTDDATWTHRFFDTETWASPGGDFATSSSASVGIGSGGAVTWGSTSALVADVQAWLDEPSTNYGWIIRGNESSGRTARRFDSREHPTAANRPALTVTFTQPTAAEDAPAAAFRLRGAYPNPFHGRTTISYDLTHPAHVRLDVYDLLGRHVARLVDTRQAGGAQRVDFDGSGLPNGLYSYRIEAEGGVTFGRLVLVR